MITIFLLGVWGQKIDNETVTVQHFKTQPQKTACITPNCTTANFRASYSHKMLIGTLITIFWWLSDDKNKCYNGNSATAPCPTRLPEHPIICINVIQLRAPIIPAHPIPIHVHVICICNNLIASPVTILLRIPHNKNRYRNGNDCYLEYLVIDINIAKLEALRERRPPWPRQIIYTNKTGDCLSVCLSVYLSVRLWAAKPHGLTGWNLEDRCKHHPMMNVGWVPLASNVILDE